jgi:hypothetical protein
MVHCPRSQLEMLFKEEAAIYIYIYIYICQQGSHAS